MTASPLIIVESPRTARTLQGRLGPSWTVLPTGGHLETGRGEGRRHAEAIRAAAGPATPLYLATDADEEGDLIAAEALAWIGRAPETALRLITPEILAPEALEIALADAAPVSPAVGRRALCRQAIDRHLMAQVAEAGPRDRGPFTPGRVQCAALGWLAGVGRHAAYTDGLPITADLWRAGAGQGVGLRQMVRGTQRLYHAGLISYPRTQSRWLGPGALADLQAWVGAAGPLRALPAEVPLGAAHGALRPAHPARDLPEAVSARRGPEEAEIYRLVWQGVINALAAPEHPWARPAPAPEGGHDGALAAALLEAGVGTPSSLPRAIEGLIEGGLIWRRPGGPLQLTPAGAAWVEALSARCPVALTADLSGALRAALEETPEGPTSSPQVVAEALLEQPTPSAAAAEVSGLARAPEISAASPRCPRCQGEMTLRRGRTGQFWGCRAFPRCRGTATLDAPSGAAPAGERPAPVRCPACEVGQLVGRRGRGGRWIYGCSEAPRCDFFSRGRPVALQCPRCQHGHLVEPEPTSPGGRGRFVVQRGTHPDAPPHPGPLRCPACGAAVSLMGGAPVVEPD